ncbi:FAD-binding oxidoreductase [Puniceicoccus vermicola]|uniref:Flavodoxin reductase n=1 Tax=Puniceicoccus vermicola TaxID=388746 RepID=A0A7X1AYD1_9BACT|nr:FAD-binding oxidoreductase [Puniceicoccus vermicola]MBC2602232.1 flavodoxin reductase [Puniceicoccus vermicola]
MPTVEIQSIQSLNYNVRQFRTEKPDGYEFTPGQATLVAIDREGLREEKRPFTFTSLPDDDFLEFTIKTYPSHEGVTDKLKELNRGEHLILEDPWGAIQFKGKGTFIAGGAGVTPMLAILRNEASKGSDAVSRLIFSNKKEKDLFLEEELKTVSEGRLLLTFTDQEVDEAEYGRVDEGFLRKHVSDFNQYFYVCGPPEMVESVEEDLEKLGADPDKIVTEES